MINCSQKMRKMRQIIKKILLFLQIDWIDTIRLNIFSLPFKQGRKFPILLFKAKLRIARGSFVRLDIAPRQCSFGMIKLGCRYSKNVLASRGIQIDLASTGGLIFRGSGIIGHGSNIVCRKNGAVSIGRNFRISGNFSLCSHTSICIGENLSCSWGVSIYDTDFHETKDAVTGIPIEMTKQVSIGNNCWLCQKCTLLKSSSISDWTTVGALALVNRSFSDLPSYSVLAGIPAKPVLKKIRRTDQAVIANLHDWNLTSGLRLLNPLPAVEAD